MSNKIHIKPYTGALGAEILGIDLSKKLSKNHFNLITNTLNEYHVVFFRKQDINPSQLVKFGQNFGALEEHPLIPTLKDFPEIIELKSADDGPGPYARNSRIWHSDMTYTKIPPMGAILKAVSIPKSGGNTMFLSACLAYNHLSDKMKTFLSKLKAVHSIVMTSTKEEILSEQGLSRFAKMQKALPPV